MLRIIVKLKRFNKDQSLAEIICCLAIGSSIFDVFMKLVPKLNGTAALTCFTRQARWSSGHKVALEGSWSCPFVSVWSRGQQAKSLKPSEKEHFCRDQSTKQWWLVLRLGLCCNIRCLTWAIQVPIPTAGDGTAHSLCPHRAEEISKSGQVSAQISFLKHKSCHCRPAAKQLHWGTYRTYSARHHIACNLHTDISVLISSISSILRKMEPSSFHFFYCWFLDISSIILPLFCWWWEVCFLFLFPIAYWILQKFLHFASSEYCHWLRLYIYHFAYCKSNDIFMQYSSVS